MAAGALTESLQSLPGLGPENSASQGSLLSQVSTRALLPTGSAANTV